MSGDVNWSPYELRPFSPRTTQRYVAHISVGASTIRKMGCKIDDIRKSLSSINLEEIQEKTFPVFLENSTNFLLTSCKGQFGTARKCLNIFLKNCYHNRFLSDQYCKPQIISQFELPLDSRTMEGVRKDGFPSLPKSSVIGLSPELNTRYQTAALAIAEKYSISRVNLDVLWWMQSDR